MDIDISQISCESVLSKYRPALADVINGRYTQKTRVHGAPSLSPIVPGAPSWAVKSDTGVAAPLRNITNVQTTPSRRDVWSTTSDPNQTFDQLRLVSVYVFI